LFPPVELNQPKAYARLVPDKSINYQLKEENLCAVLQG
jgi:hypothetical protein